MLRWVKKAVENDDIEEVNELIVIIMNLLLLLPMIITIAITIIIVIMINHDDQVNERMLEKAVEGQLGSAAKYGEHQDAAVLFCKFTTNQNS